MFSLHFKENKSTDQSSCIHCDDRFIYEMRSQDAINRPLNKEIALALDQIIRQITNSFYFNFFDSPNYEPEYIP